MNPTLQRTTKPKTKTNNPCQPLDTLVSFTGDAFNLYPDLKFIDYMN